MGKPTPCGPCPKPYELSQANEVAWEVFILMSSQLRVAGMGTVLGVDISTFPAVCDVKEVPAKERRFLLDKILKINSIALRYWNKDPDTE